MDNPLQIILILLGFGSILFLTYVTTKFIAGRSSKALKGRHIQIVETVSLGLDKRIHLVRAGSKYILVASTSKNIEFLSEVDVGEAGEAEPATPGLQNVFNFKELFDKYVGAYRSRNDNNSIVKSDQTVSETGERGFRTNLGRLRTIVRKTDQIEKDGDDFTNEK